METTTRTELQEPEDTPQVFSTSAEPLNATNLTTSHQAEDSKFCSHLGCGENTSNGGGMSAKHNVFVLGVNGKPLTPTTSTKARKLMKGNQAKPVWNKFSQFGIQMLVKTRIETPKTVLGIDNGTKFEGYSLISGNENIMNVMWLLPDKKKTVRKIEERKRLRRARRGRNCRRRPSRFDNRNRDGFIAPSQKVMVDSRLKCIREFFKCYPIQKVAIEDVRFNHRDKKWGKNFSTVEIGKNMIEKYIISNISRENYIKFDGFESQTIRTKLGLKKSTQKDKQSFDSHCVDSFSIAYAISSAEPNLNIYVVDDAYRPVRRRLHDTEFSKGDVRPKYSSGNFKSIRKGTICQFGQIVGGTEKVGIWYRDWSDVPQKGKTLKKILWFSKQFKTKYMGAIHPHPFGWRSSCPVGDKEKGDGFA